MATERELGKLREENLKLQRELRRTGEISEDNLEVYKEQAKEIKGTKEEVKKLIAFNQQLTAQLRQIENSASDLASSFRSIVEELSNSRQIVNDTNSIFRTLTKGAQELVNIEKGYVSLSSKELNLLQKKAKQEQSRAEESIKFLERQEKLTKKQEESLVNLKGAFSFEGEFDRYIKLLSTITKEQEKLEKSLGITGALLKSLTKIPGLESISAQLDISKFTEVGEGFLKDKLEEEKNKILKANADLQAELKTKLREEFPVVAKGDRNLGLAYKRLKRLDDETKGIGAEYEYVAKKLDEAIKLQDEELIKEFSSKLDVVTEQMLKELDDIYDKFPLLEKREEIKIEISSLEREAKNIEKLSEKAQKATFTFTNRVKAIGLGIGELGKSAATALTDPLTIFTFLGKALVSINEQTTKLTKSLVLSAQKASDLRDEFSDVADNSGKTFITTKRLIEAQNEFNRVLGLQGRVISENAETFVRLQKAVGLGVEEAARLQFFAEATGKDFEQQYLTQLENIQAISAQFGVQLNQKQVLEEIGKQSAYTLAQFQGSTEQLGEAVALAKALGLELSTVNKIAGQLLEFETSITAELQAELLLGKDINLERARLAALNNDQITLMEELNREMGDFNDFSSMNRIQQEAIAKALGMSVEEMSDMLLLQQYEQKNRTEIVALAGEEVANRVETLSLQQRFNDAIEKLQDLVVNLVEGPLGRFASFVADLAQNSVILEASIGALAGLSLVKLVGSLGAMAVQMGILSAGAITLSSALTFGLGAIAIGGGVAAALAYYNRAKDEMTRVDDFISPGYGKRVLSMPEGSIALNDKDTIVAGTNLTQNSVINRNDSYMNQNSTINQPTTTQTTNTNNATQMMADNSSELKAIKNILEKIATNEGSININGTKFGTVTAMNTYQIQ